VSALRIVGVGDLACSADPQETLVTYALGSCIGVTAWDRQAHVAGMLHFMLPLSSVNPEKAAANPAMFGDTGLPALLEGLFRLGAQRRSLELRLAGGAEISGGDAFEIGRRNILLARRLLWKNGLAPIAESVGGRQSRTIKLEVGSGRVLLKEPGGERPF
jgi:chemotaxis protein CheD